MTTTKPSINQRTLYVFYELLKSYETIGSIQKLFEAEGVFAADNFRSTLSSQREATAEEYVKSLDLSNPNDLRRFHNVIESFVIKKENRYPDGVDEEWTQFLRLLERDGYIIENQRVRKVGGIDIPDIVTLTDKYGMEHLKTDWDRAVSQYSTDPEDAITAARSMIESTCKWILDQLNIEYTDKHDISDIYRKAALELKLGPDQHGEQVFKQILGSLQGSVTGLATLRNKYGDSHGKGEKYYKPSTRHAKLAVNASGTLCTFLIETYLASHEAKSQTSFM